VIPTLSTKLIAMIVGALLIVGLLIFGVRQCEQRRNAASQARVEQSQAGAAQQSAKDAIEAVGASAARETASEAMTRENEANIRAAEGADAPVNPAVRDAGIAALCQRKAYANDPRCRRP
jgi:hypothetical protein